MLTLLVTGSCLTPRNRAAVELLPAGETDGHIKEACAVTARTCTRCHDLGRVVAARQQTPERWRLLVDRMRLMRSSGITPSEEEAAVLCLTYRELGVQP